jgi:CBS domain-containing protein
MAPTMKHAAPPQLTLWAEKAADLMMPNPVSLRDDATVREAIESLIDHGYSAAPVIDEAGRAVGVLSRADILVHDRAKGARPGAAYYERADLETAGERLGVGFHVEVVDTALVRDIMMPAVFSVGPDATPAQVVEQMLELKVHRLFVMEKDGTLVGVISALDVLRHLRADAEDESAIAIGTAP